MNRTKKIILLFVIMVAIVMAPYLWRPSQNLNDVRITTFGEHFIPASELVESISITDTGTEFEVLVKFGASIKRKPSWNLFTQIGTPDWNPFTKGYYSKSFSNIKMMVKKADIWETTISESEKFHKVIFKTKTRWWSATILLTKGIMFDIELDNGLISELEPSTVRD